MTAKEYLSQAKHLDARINSKIQQLDSLNAMATKCTSTFSDMPRNSNIGYSRMEETICKIIDLKDEINRDIDRLVDLKREIITVISAVPDTELQAILEKRYICGKTWSVIALELGYKPRHLYKLHDEALKKVKIPEKYLSVQ